MCGIAVCKLRNGKFGISFAQVLNLLIYLIPISILSARLYYVLFDLKYFLAKPVQILNLRTGGLAIYGGIIGGWITTYFFCKKRKINMLDLMDYIVPSLAIGQAIGRWGNFVNVEAYGTETTSIFRMGIIENGKYLEVHPAFLYESIATIIIFFIIINMGTGLYPKQITRKYAGKITYMYLIMYSFARFFIERIRIDSLMIYNFRISQILSLIIFVVFCIILSYNEVKFHKNIQSSIK